MTGTAMLSIYISDENDNVPSLNVSTIDICQSSGPSLAKITVFDLDEDPYAGPFHFKLIGDVAGSWKVDPDQGKYLGLKHSQDYLTHKSISTLYSMSEQIVIYILYMQVTRST